MKKIDSPNAVIEFHDSFVKKVLKRNSTVEKTARFLLECRILSDLDSNKYDVAEIYDVNDTDTPYWYTMKIYESDSNSALSFTKGDVKKVIELLLPIIKTLRDLASLSKPIYHRDLKPENILIEIKDSAMKFILADFGCAFIQDHSEDRLTKDFRAVGARAFLAPEFHHGRVEIIDEKGDIFSLGKLLWYYINGIENDVFPFTLWFTQEYNIVNRHPEAPFINEICCVIASCTHHAPESRISYEKLIASLNSILIMSMKSDSQRQNVNALLYENRRALNIETSKAKAENIVSVLIEDLIQIYSDAIVAYGATDFLNEILKSIAISNGLERVIETVIDRDSNCPIWNYQVPGISIQTRIFPLSNLAGSRKQFSTKYTYVDFTITTTDLEGESLDGNATIYFEDEIPMVVVNGEKFEERRAELKKLIFSHLNHLFSS